MTVNAVLFGGKKLSFRLWREISVFMLIAMQVSWVTPWFRSLTPSTYSIHPGVVYIVLFSVFLVAHMNARILDALNLRTKIRISFTLLLLVIFIVIGLGIFLHPGELGSLPFLNEEPKLGMIDQRSIIPEEFLVILVILLTWWRGIILAQEHIEPHTVMRYLLVGILMFIIFVIVNTLVTGETPGVFLYLFLFCGLIAMAAARISILKQLRGGSLSSLDRRWFLALISAAVVVVGLSAGVAEGLSGGIGWISTIVLGLIGLLVVMLWLIISPLLALVLFLISDVNIDSPAIKQIADTIGNIQRMIEGLMHHISGSIGSSELVAAILQNLPYLRVAFLIFVVTLMVAGLIMWIVMTLWRDRAHTIIEKEEQSILTRAALWHMLKKYFRHQWDNLKDEIGKAVDLRHRQRLRAAARIRQIYAQLLELADQLGCSRLSAQTPLEFMPALILSFPSVDTELELITNAYLKIRYGQLSESVADVIAVEQAWAKVVEIGNARIEGQKRKKSPLTNNDGRGNY